MDGTGQNESLAAEADDLITRLVRELEEVIGVIQQPYRSLERLRAAPDPDGQVRLAPDAA